MIYALRNPSEVWPRVTCKWRGRMVIPVMVNWCQRCGSVLRLIRQRWSLATSHYQQSEPGGLFSLFILPRGFYLLAVTFSVAFKFPLYEEIPRRPVDRNWLLKMTSSSSSCVLEPAESPWSRDCMEPLEKADYKVRFGIWSEDLKVFRSKKPVGGLDIFAIANELRR